MINNNSKRTTPFRLRAKIYKCRTNSQSSIDRYRSQLATLCKFGPIHSKFFPFTNLRFEYIFFRWNTSSPDQTHRIEMIA